MPYVASDPDANLGMVVGDGNCVAYVKRAANCPATAAWRSGAKARGGGLPKGTAIATFQGGVYGNYTDGRSHAAIFLHEAANGLVVHDQWKGMPVHERTIFFRNGQGDARNDGDAFTVIEPGSLFQSIRNRVKDLLSPILSK